jgi:hypothetical protein
MGTSYGMQDSGCRIQDTGFRIQDTSYRFKIGNLKLET